jgi:hypothetical protein
VENFYSEKYFCTYIDGKLYLPETMTSDCSATAFAEPKTYERKKIERKAKTTFFVVLEFA